MPISQLPGGVLVVDEMASLRFRSWKVPTAEWMKEGILATLHQLNGYLSCGIELKDIDTEDVDPNSKKKW